MSKAPDSLNQKALKVFPLASRRSMARVEEILVNPDSAPPPLANDWIRERVESCAKQIRAARQRNASVQFFYGAHLVKNGAQSLMDRLLAGGWVTHLATN